MIDESTLKLKENNAKGDIYN